MLLSNVNFYESLFVLLNVKYWSSRIVKLCSGNIIMMRRCFKDHVDLKIRTKQII